MQILLMVPFLLLEMSSEMRILITGTREDGPHCVKVVEVVSQLWLDMDQPNFAEWTIVHGNCQTGVDSIAETIANVKGMQSEAHPADWERWGKSAGPRRNQEMVDLGADLVLAFPKGASRGTRGCLKMAQEAGLKVVVYELDSTPEN
jgi:hypothetical protein